MADPYQWSDNRSDGGEQDSRRAAERHAEQERLERARRQKGDYASGWYGEEASRRGYDVPGPYGRASEQLSLIHI